MIIDKKKTFKTIFKEETFLSIIKGRGHHSHKREKTNTKN